MNLLLSTPSSIHYALQLKEIAHKSISPEFNFQEALHQIEKVFLDIARKEVPVMHQSGVLSQVRFEFNQLENYCKGIQLLETVPPAITLHFVNTPDVLIRFIVNSAEEFTHRLNVIVA